MDVNIAKRIDTPDGRRFCPVILGAGGRVRPDWVMVNGHQVNHPEGAYYLDWTEDGVRRRTAVGTDATVTVTSGGSPSGCGGGTYVPGTVGMIFIKLGVNRHSIDLG